MLLFLSTARCGSPRAEGVRCIWLVRSFYVDACNVIYLSNFVNIYLAEVNAAKVTETVTPKKEITS